MFTGVDRALVLAALAAKLRTAGVIVPVGATGRATAALAVVTASPGSGQDGGLSIDNLYWLTRLSFVIDHSQFNTFDKVFDAVFRTHYARNEHRSDNGRRSGPPAPPADNQQHHRLRQAANGDVPTEGAGLPWTTLPTVVADADDEDDETASERQAIPDLLPARLAGDPDRPFDLLDPVEMERAGRALEASIQQWPLRASRRNRLAATGARLELRAALRRALRTGGEPLVLPSSRTRTRPRRVAMLIDVSGSMESFATAYFHVGRALAMGRRAEVFAFATALTRITPALRLHSPTEAIDRASTEVGDRFGGTRLATSLATLLRHRSWGSAARGAIVVIVSDGWDTDPPELLTRQIARLQRTAHRLVWVNPRLAADGFEPQVAAMATALPYCDHFLPGHSLSAMTDVVDAIVTN